MKIQEIRYKLLNDFAFLVAVIVNNNPVAVTENLNKVYDKNPENKEALINIILEFKEAGQEALVSRILSVPFIEENASVNMIKAWESIKSDVNNVSGGSSISEFKDWSGGMFMAIGMLGSAYLGNQGGTGGGGYYPDPQPREDFTMYWIIGAVVVLIIIAVIIMAVKGGKGSKKA